MNETTFIPFPQQIHFDIPDDAFTGFTRIRGIDGIIRGYPVIVTPPNWSYYEMFMRKDGGVIERTNYWCSPFQPWAFIPYQLHQPDYANVKVLEIIVTPLKAGIYPQKIWTPPS